jgi:protein phosphatase
MGMPYWLVVNIGDSRTYRLSQGRFEQISVDHSEVQELVDAGEITAQEATVHPRRHVVTRALGTGDETEADYWLLPVEEGDRVLVCSDGLTGEVADDAILRILSSVADPQEAVDALIQAALRSGGRDNITAIVVDARNVSNDDGTGTTAPRLTSADGDEVTLPRPQASEAVTQPLPAPVEETADHNGEPDDDRR